MEEDDEALKKELKEAFRIYDKDQQGFITTGESDIIGMMESARKRMNESKEFIEVAKHSNDGMSS